MGVAAKGNAKGRIKGHIEIAFNLIYLFTVLFAASLLYKTAETGSIKWKFAIMSFILGVGDSFHLIPRVLALIDKGSHDYTALCGIGKLVTSITMTVFYMFLWEIGKEYYAFSISNNLSIIIYGLALLRVILCLFPHNQWTYNNSPVRWRIIRNIPFLILGIIVMALFLTGAIIHGGSLYYLWLAILISFICYMPVVLFVHKKPAVGMLMLPKSCAYVAIVLMGFLIA